MTKSGLAPDLQVWVDARKQHRLSHLIVQMARELGMNPRKLGGLNNHRQEPWKAPLPEFIMELYRQRFGRSEPEKPMTIEEIARKQWEKKQEGQARRATERKLAENSDEPPF
jgi:phage terminase small subunit